jgi:hypothetical protein
VRGIWADIDVYQRRCEKSGDLVSNVIDATEDEDLLMEGLFLVLLLDWCLFVIHLLDIAGKSSSIRYRRGNRLLRRGRRGQDTGSECKGRENERQSRNRRIKGRQKAYRRLEEEESERTLVPCR